MRRISLWTTPCRERRKPPMRTKVVTRINWRGKLVRTYRVMPNNNRQRRLILKLRCA